MFFKLLGRGSGLDTARSEHLLKEQSVVRDTVFSEVLLLISRFLSKDLLAYVSKTPGAENPVKN